jgi:hypothetical protein
MAIDLKKLATSEKKLDELTLGVKFKELTFVIRYVSKTTMFQLANQCRVAEYDAKSKGRVVGIDPDKFMEGLCKTVVKDWQGVTPRKLANLYPVDLSSLTEAQKDEEIPFSIENLIEVMKHAPGLDDFLHECATEPALFKNPAEESLEKNSSTSQSIT